MISVEIYTRSCRNETDIFNFNYFSSYCSYFGVLLGTIAGYFNHIDNLIMRILDVVFAIPSLLLAVAIIASFGASIPNLIIALSIGNIPSFARTMRASVLEIKRMEYVDAARITGENTWNIIWRYILPNAIAPMIVRFH